MCKFHTIVAVVFKFSHSSGSAVYAFLCGYTPVTVFVI